MDRNFYTGMDRYWSDRMVKPLPEKTKKQKAALKKVQAQEK